MEMEIETPRNREAGEIVDDMLREAVDCCNVFVPLSTGR